MIRPALLGALLAAFVLPKAANAQLVLSIVDGATETVVQNGSVYQMRPVESGMPSSILVRIRNTGNAPLDVTQWSAVGTGFSFDRLLPPRTLDRGGILNGTLTFSATSPASYNAAVRMNSMTVAVLITVLNAASVEVGDPCTRTSGTDTIAFGTRWVGDHVLCDITVRNPTTQSITIHGASVNGPGFSLMDVSTPLTLAPGGAIVFTLRLDVQGGGSIAGVMMINARQFALSATGVDLPVPQPFLDWGTDAVSSGQQRKLTITLPGPSTITASGMIDLSFQSNVTSFNEDPAVMFVETGGRRVRFSLEKGKTEVRLNDAPFVTFQTGTTAGAIRFTLSGIAQGFTADPNVTLVVPPALIVLDEATAARLTGLLRFEVSGFDNTFTAGSMLFRFFDAKGQQITAAIPADFSTSFRNYFAATKSGSTFRARVQFPVTGDSSGIASMEAELSNAAGTVRTARVTF